MFLVGKGIWNISVIWTIALSNQKKDMFSKTGEVSLLILETETQVLVNKNVVMYFILNFNISWREWKNSWLFNYNKRIIAAFEGSFWAGSFCVSNFKVKEIANF